MTLSKLILAALFALAASTAHAAWSYRDLQTPVTPGSHSPNITVTANVAGETLTFGPFWAGQTAELHVGFVPPLEPGFPLSYTTTIADATDYPFGGVTRTFTVDSPASLLTWNLYFVQVEPIKLGDNIYTQGIVEHEFRFAPEPGGVLVLIAVAILGIRRWRCDCITKSPALG